MVETIYDSPVGRLYIGTDEGTLRCLSFSSLYCESGCSEVARRTIEQLEEYFEGQRTQFDLPIKMDGTDFQKKCWEALMKIGYGETVTYAEEARMIGSPKALRAVGMANHRNPIAIVVPCHRVVASGGKIGGYGGGVEVKRRLLEIEMGGKIVLS